jgi:hypothetical protein
MLIDAKAFMVIGSLCPISVQGVIRGLRWGIGCKGAEALISSHMDVNSARPFIGQHKGEGTDKRNEYPYGMR